MARMLTIFALDRVVSCRSLVHEAATNGNYGPLAAQAEMIGHDLERMIAMGMHHSVVCAEEAPHFADAVDRKALEATAIGAVIWTACRPSARTGRAVRWTPTSPKPLDSARAGAPALRRVRPGNARGLGATCGEGSKYGLHVVAPGQGHGQAAALRAEAACASSSTQAVPAGPRHVLCRDDQAAHLFLSFSGSAP